jgi:hypothetical protein
VAPDRPWHGPGNKQFQSGLNQAFFLRELDFVFGSAWDGRCGNQLSSISKISVSERITERWITFCNSRMFPGQGYKLKQFEHLLADTPYVLGPLFVRSNR